MFKKFSKLFLTLAMLLGVTSAWADVETIFDAAASDWTATGVNLTTGTTKVGSVTWYGGGSAEIATGNKTFSDDQKWTARLKFGGASTINTKNDLARVIKFTVSSGGTVKVYAVTGSKDANRYVLVSQSMTETNRDESTALVKANTNPDGIASATVEKGDVYVWADSNIGIYGITFEATGADAPTLVSKEVTGIKINGKVYEPTIMGATGSYTIEGEYNFPPVVSIVQTSTYSDNKTNDNETTVTFVFDPTKACFQGTATIGETAYNFIAAAKALSTTLADVTGSTVWDWSKTGATAIQLTENSTYPTKNDKFILGDLIPNTTDFNSDALEVMTEYAVRDGKYFQGGHVKFNTTVPGTVKVTFSNTGDRKGDETLTRYLHVNGTKTEWGANNATAVTSGEIEVPAGEVVLTSKMSSSEDDQYIRIYSIEFTAAAGPQPKEWESYELVLNKKGLLTEEDMTKIDDAYPSVSFGVALDEDGKPVRVAADSEEAIAVISGKYHSDHGMNPFSMKAKVPGAVKITAGTCSYGTCTVTVDGKAVGEPVEGDNATMCWKNNAANVATGIYEGEAGEITITTGCYTPYIKLEKYTAPTPPTTDPDADYELKEKVVYSTKFQDWEKMSADATNETKITKTTTDDQELVFTLLDTAVDPEGTNSKFSNDCVTVGYLQTNKSAIASITTSPLESITKLELVQAATGGTRGITVYVKGDGDEDWVELHNKSIAAAAGETLTFDVNRTNCQIKFGNFSASQNAYITSLKISGNVKVAKRTFQDFKVDFRIKSGEQAYTLVSPADGLPEGVTINAGTYNGGQHGAQNPTVSVKVDGPVKFTIGSCQFGNHTVTVKDETGATIATVDNNNGCENGYTAIENCTYNNYVVYTYNNEKPATLTFIVNGFCPFFIAEQCEFIPSVTVSYYGLDNKLIKEEVVDGGSDLKFACSETDLAIPDGMAFRGWFDGSSANAMKVQEGISLTTDTKLYAKATDIEVATVGSVWNYDLTKKNFYQEDHELIEMTGKYNNNHGWAFGAGQTIKLQVAGNAIVNFTLCQFGNEGTIVATDAAGNTFGETITTPVSADGNSASISYKGEATTLTFTLTNGGYVHGVKVFNVTEIPEKNDAGYYVVNPNDGASLLLILANVQAGDKIFLPNGTYDFGETTGTTIGVNNLSIIGESMEGTIIRNCPPISNEGLGKADLFYNASTGLYMQDLTLQNDLDYYGSGAAGRAAVLQDNGNQTILRNVAMRSYQDTYYSKSGNYYFEGGLIQGTVDYICGGGNAWFEDITLLNKSRAASGQSGDDTMTAYNGTGMYVFNNCSVESECSTFNFGRSWADAYVVYLNTTIKSGKLVDTRFSTADMNTAPRFYGEYNTVDNSGNGKDTPASNVLTTSKGATFESVLTADQAAAYTLESMFSAWDPKTIATQVEEMPKATEGLVYLVNGEITTTCPVAGTKVRIANTRGGFGPAVTVVEDTATAISTVNASANANAPVYNITGQRVAAGTKGIVIIGGQKYVRK